MEQALLLFFGIVKCYSFIQDENFTNFIGKVFFRRQKLSQMVKYFSMLFYFLSGKKQIPCKTIWRKIYFSETSSLVNKAFLCASVTVTAAGKEHKDKDTEIFLLFPLVVIFLFIFLEEKFCKVHKVMLSFVRSQTRKK